MCFKRALKKVFPTITFYIFLGIKFPKVEEDDKKYVVLLSFFFFFLFVKHCPPLICRFWSSKATIQLLILGLISLI